jgi:acetyl esterase/lipase
VHGEGDLTVSPFNTSRLAAELEARGVDVTLRMYPRLGHADTVAALSELARRRAPVLADIEQFLRTDGRARQTRAHYAHDEGGLT